MGHRFYIPDTGRWLNRDPLGEKGVSRFRGLAHRLTSRAKRVALKSLYHFISNDPIRRIDYLGLFCGITVNKDSGSQWGHEVINLGDGTAVDFGPGNGDSAPVLTPGISDILRPPHNPTNGDTVWQVGWANGGNTCERRRNCAGLRQCIREKMLEFHQQTYCPIGANCIDRALSALRACNLVKTSSVVIGAPDPEEDDDESEDEEDYYYY